MSMSINETGRTAAQNADAIAATRATAAVQADSSNASSAAGTNTSTGTSTGTRSDEPTLSSDLKDPAPRHFPWLSRLTSQLESSSTQKSPFGSSSLTGETLNQSA